MNINDKELAVEIEGPEDAPAVVLVHGLGGTSNFYQVQAQALAERHRVIRIDSAGAGRSANSENISISSHAEDIAGVLDALGIESAAVVGHSMGTLVVREFAAKYPERVTKLVLLGAVREPAEPGRQAQRDRAVVLRDKGTAAVAPGVVANALSEATRTDKPEVAAFVREMVMRQDPEGYARNCEALAAATDPGPVSRTIGSAADHRRRRQGGPARCQPRNRHRSWLGNCEVLPNVGHWTAVEAAGPVTDLLVEFL